MGIILGIFFFFKEAGAFLIHCLGVSIPLAFSRFASNSLNLCIPLLSLWLISFGVSFQKGHKKILYGMSLALVAFWMLYWISHPLLVFFLRLQKDGADFGTLVFHLPRGKIDRIPFYIDIILTVYIMAERVWASVSPSVLKYKARFVDAVNRSSQWVFIRERLGRFATVFYIVLILAIVECLLFSQGWIWKIKPAVNGSTLPGRIVNTSYFHEKLSDLNHAKSGKGDAVGIAFVGNSTVRAAFDERKTGTELAARFPGRGFDCYSFAWAGFNAYETPLVVDQIARSRDVNICAYGIYLGAFTHYPQRLGTVYSKPLNSRAPDFSDRESFFEELLLRHWKYFRYRGFIKEYVDNQIASVFDRLARESGSVPPDKRAGRQIGAMSLEKWRKAGDFTDHLLYIESIRDASYIQSHLSPELESAQLELIDTNLEYIEETLEICRERDIVFVAVSMPINPILKEQGVQATREFIDSKIRPFLEKNDVVFFDFSDGFEAELFVDYNHLNAKGRKAFSSLFADKLADTVLRDGIPPPRSQ